MAKYRTRNYQTVYDLAIQLYGDLSSIGKIIRLFPNLDERIPAGEEFDFEASSDPIARYFAERGTVIATDIIAVQVDGGNYRILENGDFRALENGDLRITEE